MKHLLFIVFVALLIVTFIACSGSDNPTQSSNRPPTVPVIDTASGAPADGATNVPLTAVLRWICMDADRDTITYTVYFGDTTTPPMIPSSQTASSFDPDTLEYSKTYYWKIVAEDSKSATSSSAVWSFTTMNEPVAETVSIPDIPAGPTSGLTGQSLSFATGNAVSNLGHALEYRFDWGASVDSNWSSATTMIHSWSVAGTWTVKAQARCAAHPTVESNWSNASADVVVTVPVETVSTPNVPAGPASGTTNSSLDYLISGAASSLGHTLEYRFDWDDGDTSLWSPTTTGSHAWGAAGTYDVALQARCETDTAIESAWSSVTTVTIADPAETVTTPGWVSGSATAAVGESQTYTINGSSNSNLGDPVEYRFDWGDGSFSTWSSGYTASHSWAGAGTFNVTAQARCSTHTSALSGSTGAKVVTVTAAAETVSTPNQPSVPSVVNVNYNVSASGIGAVSSYGHTIEYRFDFGDGTIGGWPSEDPWGYQHRYTNAGTYSVTAQARCATDTSIVSAWSVSSTITVNEIVSKPTKPTGPTSGIVGDTLTYTTGGSVSSEGHSVEYIFRFTDSYGSVLDSTSWSALTSQDHIFTTPNTYYCYAYARCVVDTNIVNYSSYLGPITITAKK